MALLKWNENIIGDKIVYTRAKTANTKKSPEPTIIKIEPEIARVLASYHGNEPFVFPVLENGLSESTKRYRVKSGLKRMSKDIKEIARELGIAEADSLTMYWARHTYATTLKRSGIPTAIISEALGHSSEATTRAYLDKFEQTAIDETYGHLI